MIVEATSTSKGPSLNVPALLVGHREFDAVSAWGEGQAITNAFSFQPQDAEALSLTPPIYFQAECFALALYGINKTPVEIEAIALQNPVPKYPDPLTFRWG